MDIGDGNSIEETRQQLITKIGENVSIRQFLTLDATGDNLGTYMHGAKIGVVVDLQGGEAALAKDIAMHVAASRPSCVEAADVPKDEVAKERDIFRAQAESSGKPAELIEKMVEGRLRKFVGEITLHGQPFVKDPDMSVEKLLKKNGASVHSFLCLVVGEGIEKKVDDFANEVISQVKHASQ